MPSGLRSVILSAFGESNGSESEQAAAAVKAKMKAKESEPPSSLAAKIDRREEKEEAEIEDVAEGMPHDISEEVGKPMLDKDAHYDPRIPRKVALAYRLEKRGAWDMRPFGLYVQGKRIYACNSADEIKLAESGQCGLIGTRDTLDGQSLLNTRTGIRALPVRRWDEKRMRWTAEEAPFISIKEWKLPRSGDGKVDIGMLPAMPRDLTEEAPGVLPDAMEGSLASLLGGGGAALAKLPAGQAACASLSALTAALTFLRAPTPSARRRTAAAARCGSEPRFRQLCSDFLSSGPVCATCTV
mmetsp:Transcript_58328/g.104443  ORF Transcript_58328/g.104443 Transcript_58328/m.104443 type:complete len:299 (+) Transcript_58328:27-923(+)